MPRKPGDSNYRTLSQTDDKTDREDLFVMRNERIIPSYVAQVKPYITAVILTKAIGCTCQSPVSRFVQSQMLFTGVAIESRNGVVSLAATRGKDS